MIRYSRSTGTYIYSAWVKNRHSVVLIEHQRRSDGIAKVQVLFSVVSAYGCVCVCSVFINAITIEPFELSS